MKKVAIAGTILVDVIKYIDNYPEKGNLCRIGKILRSVGGCVPNTGIVLKMLAPERIRVSAVGRIGADENGKFITTVLQDHGIDTSPIMTDEENPTSFTDVMTLSSGERTFFSEEGANAFLSEEDVLRGLPDSDLFHVGYLLLLRMLDSPDAEYGTKMARLLKQVRDRGISTSIDAVSTKDDRFREVILPSLPYCDHIVVNELEAESIAGIPLRENGLLLRQNLRDVCEKLRRYGVKSTIAVHCPELGCALEKDGTFTIVPSLDIPADQIVGAVGAGDSFCAGMLYSFLHGMSAEEGLRLASCAAACNLRSADSVSGARDLRKTMSLEREYGRK